MSPEWLKYQFQVNYPTNLVLMELFIVYYLLYMLFYLNQMCYIWSDVAELKLLPSSLSADMNWSLFLGLLLWKEWRLWSTCPLNL